MGGTFFDEGENPLRDPFAAAFLARLRNRAEAWNLDVHPTDTGVETMSNPVAVRINVPGLSGPVTALWVLCHHAPERSPILHGSWATRSTSETTTAATPFVI